MADQLVELDLGLRIAPSGQAHGHERGSAHQRRRGDHPERYVLERTHSANRAEALAHHDRHQAERQRDQRGQADAPQMPCAGPRGPRGGRPARRA